MVTAIFFDTLVAIIGGLGQLGPPAGAATPAGRAVHVEGTFRATGAGVGMRDDMYDDKRASHDVAMRGGRCRMQPDKMEQIGAQTAMHKYLMTR